MASLQSCTGIELALERVRLPHYKGYQQTLPGVRGESGRLFIQAVIPNGTIVIDHQVEMAIEQCAVLNT